MLISPWISVTAVIDEYMFRLHEPFGYYKPVIWTVVNNLHPLISLSFRKFKTASNCSAEQTTDTWMLFFQYGLCLIYVAWHEFVRLSYCLRRMQEKIELLTPVPLFSDTATSRRHKLLRGNKKYRITVQKYFQISLHYLYRIIGDYSWDRHVHFVGK